MGSVCSRRPSKADPRPVWLPGYERRGTPQDLAAIIEAQEQEDIANDEAPPTCTQVLLFLPAVAWSLCGWNVVIGSAEAIYWHFLDRRGGGVLPSVVTAGACTASLLLLDCCGLQRLASTHAGMVSFAPPLLYGLSALPSADARSRCLTAAAGALAWSAAGVLGSPPEAPRRQRDCWACLISLIALLMLRWSCASINPFLTEPAAKVALACAGVLSAAASSWEERAARRAADAGDPADKSPQGGGDCGNCRSCLDFGNWPSAAATGVMGGSALVLFETYLSTLLGPATDTFRSPVYLLGLWTLVALTVGIVALFAVISMVPWWLDTCQAALVVGLLPLLGCALQSYAGVSVEFWGPVRGTGDLAHKGLLLLAVAFPFMLALFSKELCLLTRCKAAGRALFIVGAVWLLGFLAHLGIVFGGSAPIWGAQLKGQSSTLALVMGLAWSLGVLGAPAGAGRPSVNELWYMRQHSGPPRRGEYTSGAVALFVALWTVFLGIAVPIRIFGAYTDAPASDSLLIVAQYNVQQGYDLNGWSNIRCVADALLSAGVDLVGLSESNSARPLSANNDVSLAYASWLKMNYFQGAPGALGSVDGGILSRFPLDDASSETLEVLMNCDHCPTQTHLWARSTVTWSGKKIEFHSVHAEWFSDSSTQIRYIADQIRMRFRKGPLILVGTFNLPKKAGQRPLDTALAHLVDGTGLTEAFGAMEPGAVSQSLPPTEFVSGLHLDYVFYRELELVGALIHRNVQCSDHMPLVASFRLEPRNPIG